MNYGHYRLNLKKANNLQIRGECFFFAYFQGKKLALFFDGCQ